MAVIVLHVMLSCLTKRKREGKRQLNKELAETGCTCLSGVVNGLIDPGGYNKIKHRSNRSLASTQI